MALREIARKLHNRFIEPHLPKRIGVLNGVPARGVIFHERDVRPDYEAELIDGIELVGKEGDHILIVGGGIGVSSVKAAETVGENGRVTTIEASSQRYKSLRETVDLSNVGGRITTKQALVGDAVSVDGDFSQAEVISPYNLPDCDVCVIDVEGAEKGILSNLEIDPRALVVEVHPNLGVSKEWATRQVQNLGYEIVQTDVEWEKKDITIYTAKWSLE